MTGGNIFPKGEDSMGGGAKYHAKHQLAILALLSESTIEQAAQKTGVGLATLSRWLTDPRFQEKYQEARRRSFEAGLSRLQSLTSSAIDALRRALSCGKTGIEIRSAATILDHARESTALLDIMARLEAVERQLREKDTL